jgi:hypothetical protein
MEERNQMDNTQTKYSQHIKLHLLVLFGYIALFIGSWATFLIGALFLVPILIGINYAVFALYRNEPIKIKDAFKFMDKSSRSTVLSHYILLGFIYAVLIVLIPVIDNILINILSVDISENIATSLIVTFITVLIYISLQTVFSFATIIKIDANVSTQEAIALSKKMVMSRPLFFIGMRLIFIFRNIAIWLVLGLRFMYYYGIIDTPTGVSGDPAMYLLIGWFALLVISTPFYEKMMVKIYLKNKERIYE